MDENGKVPRGQSPTYVDGIRKKLLGKSNKPAHLKHVVTDSYLFNHSPPSPSGKKRHRITLHQCGEALDWFNAVASNINERLPETLNNINAAVYNTEALLTRLNKLAEQNIPATIDSVREASEKVADAAANDDARSILARLNGALAAATKAQPIFLKSSAFAAIIFIGSYGLNVLSSILSDDHVLSAAKPILLTIYNLLVALMMFIFALALRALSPLIFADMKRTKD